MGFQSAFNRSLGTVAGAAFGIKKTLSEKNAAKAKSSVKEKIKSKQTGTKMTTRNTIQEVMKEATLGRLSDEQIKTLSSQMNKKQRREFKENYIKEMNPDGNKQ